MKHKILSLITITCLGLLLSACGPKTTITSSWVNPKLPSDVTKVLVLGLNKEETSRRLWEKTYVRLLQEYKVNAVAASELQKEPVQPNKKSIEQIIQKAGADAVIITHLVRSDTTTKWHPGTVYYEPSAFYGGIYGYYDTAFRAVYTQPTISTKTYVTLETKLYDARSTNLLWSAESITKDPKLLKSDFESIVSSLLKDMKKNKLL